MKYRTVRKFLDGFFAGTTYTEHTNVRMEVGKVYESAITGIHYIVLECTEI